MFKQRMHESLLVEILKKSSSLTERLNILSNHNKAKENDGIVNSKLKQWCQVVAQDDWEKFENFIAWYGLDFKTANNIIEFVNIGKITHLPVWLETFNEYLKNVNLIKFKTLETENLVNKDGRHINEVIPFEEVLLPFLYVARQKLVAQAGSHYNLLSKETHTSFERSLLWRLSHICSPTIELEFSVFRATKQPSVTRLIGKLGNNSKEYYQNFVKYLFEEGLLKFFQEYPVLARLAATVTDLWVDATREFLYRLESDRLQIQKTFQPDTELGKVISVQANLSDYHNNGRSVIAVQFASSLKLIYKPKDIGLEEAYFRLLSWFNEQRLFLPFKLLKTINRSTYGWVEFAESLPCKEQAEAQRYYQRAGALLCLAYILEGTDLHNENIIACGEHPVLIDLETLMHPVFYHPEALRDVKTAQELAHQKLNYSVLRSGLLPYGKFQVGNRSYDSSGLGGSNIQETLFPVKKWKNINSDMMVVAQEYEKISPHTNVPSLEGFYLSLNDYYKEFVDGFRQLYELLIEHKQALLASDSPLTTFAKQQVRFVFRPTAVYSSLLEKTLNPKFMRDGADRSIQLDLLSRGVVNSDTKPSFWPLIKVEKQALEQMDIPLFAAHADSDALTVGDNQTIEKYFTEPSFDRVIARIRQLSNEDLEQQLSFIKAALYAKTVAKPHSFSLSDSFDRVECTVSPLTPDETVNKAIAIASDLRKQAICSSDGSATWISPQYNFETQSFQLQPMDYSLYEGSCGVALFLAALEKISSGAGFRDLALGALQSLCQDLWKPVSTYIPKTIGIGGASGCGSTIYGLVHISQFLEEPTLLEDAKRLASLITPEIISADKTFDIISGSAGLILGILALHKISDDSKILNLAITCGHHLLNNRVTSSLGHRTWGDLDGKMLTGFSHGAAGIAYTLLRLHKVTGDTILLEAAQEAIAYERSVFISEVGNWPDFRESSTKKGTTCMCSWCHGAPGIGLARVAGLDILDTHEIRQDIEAAINTTKQHELSNMDHLCCGNLGRVEFLFTAARKLSQPDLLEIAMQQAAHVVARAQNNGGFAYGSVLAYSPGFFQGPAGIGYEILRLAYPDQLPSVLLWE